MFCQAWIWMEPLMLALSPHRCAAPNKRKNNKHGEGTGGIDRCGGFCEGHRGLYTLSLSLTQKGEGKSERAGANTFKASE